MRKFFCFLHEWSRWSHPVDTTTERIKLQFSKCRKCGKVRVSEIDVGGAMSSIVTAATINTQLEEVCKQERVIPQ